MTRMQLPDDVEALKDVALALHRRVEILSNKLAAYEQRKSPSNTESGQEVFEFAEPSKAAEPAVEKTQEPRGSAPHGRRPIVENIPVERREYPPLETDRTCGCGQARIKIGEEISKQYEYVPASLRVIEHARIKYACPTCKDSVVTGPLPEKVIDKGLAGPGLLAQIVTSKYGDHLPLYRQEDILARHGVQIPRSTQCQWVAQVADLLEPIYGAMVAEVLKSKRIHTDDTTVQLQEKGSGKTRTARFWTYVGDEAHPQTVYTFTLSRNRDGPQEFLKGYNGYLQADAYGGYDGLYLSGAIKEVACWAHARRKFDEARNTNPRAAEMLALIRKLYDVEDKARGQPPRIRQHLRELQSVPELHRMHAWLKTQSVNALPKSPLGQAVQYCMRQWAALVRYTEDGSLEPDNNAAERALRGIAIGRKNWLFVGSENGGRRAAILFSLIATCKRHGTDPFAYLRDVLVRISRHPASQVAALTPAYWRSSTY
jgi:transposase